MFSCTQTISVKLEADDEPPFVGPSSTEASSREVSRGRLTEKTRCAVAKAPADVDKGLEVREASMSVLNAFSLYISCFG